jgi:hypothetical protein
MMLGCLDKLGIDKEILFRPAIGFAHGSNAPHTGYMIGAVRE